MLPKKARAKDTTCTSNFSLILLESWAPLIIISNIKSSLMMSTSGSLILLVYHTLYQWPGWGCGLRHGRTAPTWPEEGGGGSRSALPEGGRKVARLDGRGGRAHMTGLTGGRAHIPGLT